MMLYTAGAVVAAGALWYTMKGTEPAKAQRNAQAKSGTPSSKVDDNPTAQTIPETRKGAV